MSSVGLFGRMMKISAYNEILPRLYLGDITMATNKEELCRLGITDMITVEVKPIQPEYLPNTIQRYLYINLMDHSKQDLLSHFETSNEFIETALKNPTNKVYVHCVAGVSRSATIVIAYVMKSRCMNFHEARDLVHLKRRVIDPNEGFVCQLMLYHQMNFKIDINNLRYRRITFEALVFEYRLVALAYYQQSHNNQFGNINPSIISHREPPTQQLQHHHHHHHLNLNSILSNKVILSIFPTLKTKTTQIISNNQTRSSNSTGKTAKTTNDVTSLFEQFFNKLHLQEVKHYPETYDTSTAYKCNKCRSIIFFPISLIENDLALTSNNNDINKVGNDQVSKGVSNDSISGTIMALNKLSFKNGFKNFAGKSSTSSRCPFYFIEPQPWMLRTISEREGILECYKCRKKLGKFDWNSKESCSCELHNSHLNMNLFKIMKKNVDKGSSLSTNSSMALGGSSSNNDRRSPNLHQSTGYANVNR